MKPQAKPSERIKQIANDKLWEASGKSPEICWGEAIIQYLDEQSTNQEEKN